MKYVYELQEIIDGDVVDEHHFDTEQERENYADFIEQKFQDIVLKRLEYHIDGGPDPMSLAKAHKESL